MELIIQIDDKRHLDMVADFVRKLGLTFRIKNKTKPNIYSATKQTKDIYLTRSKI